MRQKLNQRRLRSVTLCLPLSLTALRAFLSPLVVLLALYNPDQTAFAICLIVAFLSDVFDGIIARRLGIATPQLRRLDSIADSLFYVAAIFAAWHLHPSILRENAGSLAVLGALEITRYLFDFLKFRREASYHMWSSKLWGIFLFLGFLTILAFGETGLFVQLAIYTGIVADIEGLAISIVLREWESDVPTLMHAFARRRSSCSDRPT
jgi:phosphatidylglycerophosphate synthase